MSRAPAAAAVQGVCCCTLGLVGKGCRRLRTTAGIPVSVLATRRYKQIHIMHGHVTGNVQVILCLEGLLWQRTVWRTSGK